VQLSCGIGETRRALVMRCARSVRDCTFDNRMASLPGGFEFEKHVAGEMRSKAVIASFGRVCMVVCLRAG
jgi:hypothetical protein